MFPPEFSNAFEYWKRPAKPARGEDSCDAIYRAVGEALSHWELLEMAMSDLFLALTGGRLKASKSYPTDRAGLERLLGALQRGEAPEDVFRDMPSAAAARAYGTIANAVGRREALEAAATVFFAEEGTEDSLQAALRTLMKNYGEASGRRGDIAHGIAMGNPGDPDAKHSGTILIPSYYNTKKTRSDGGSSQAGSNELFRRYAYAFTEKHIKDYSGKFANLFHCVRVFHYSLCAEHHCAYPRLAPRPE